MYADIIKIRYSPPVILVRESFRQNDKVRKRTLAGLSPSCHPEPSRRYAVTSREKPAPGRTASRSSGSQPHDHVVTALDALRNCSLDTRIDRQRSAERDRVCAMIVARILDPRSKLATARALAAETSSDTDQRRRLE